jgi:UDP-GlcNAc:undecaprenyl-phosphate GlcNAc-1-phosphate transferase
MKTCLILIWILLPFWRFDFSGKILMWDSWTMFLGFMLATLAIIAGWKIATVLVVFWIYSVDAVYVIIRRLWKKKNPLKWDFTHLHHRLLDIWLTKKEVLFSIYILSFLFWLTALFLDKTWKIIVFGIIVVIVIFINKIIEKLMLKNKKKSSKI